MRYALTLLFLLTFLTASCGSPAQNSSRAANEMPPVRLPEDSNSGRTAANANCTTCITMPAEKGTPAVNDQPGEVPPPETVIKNPDPNFYRGCWMSNPNAGISITETTIQTNKSAKPLRYQDVTDDDAKAKGMRVLEILDADASNELKRLISLEDKPEGQMQGRGYDSLDDLHTNHPNTIYALWAAVDCKLLAPLLKGSGAPSKPVQQPAR